MLRYFAKYDAKYKNIEKFIEIDIEQEVLFIDNHVANTRKVKLHTINHGALIDANIISDFNTLLNDAGLEHFIRIDIGIICNMEKIKYVDYEWDWIYFTDNPSKDSVRTRFARAATKIVERYYPKPSKSPKSKTASIIEDFLGFNR